MENAKSRIQTDIEKLEKKLEKVSGQIKELAKAYLEDAKYYLERGDLLTAFACVSYGHGLVDGAALSSRRELEF